MPDPFVKLVDKLPGDNCINNYECISNKCISNVCGGYGKDMNCTHDN